MANKNMNSAASKVVSIPNYKEKPYDVVSNELDVASVLGEVQNAYLSLKKDKELADEANKKISNLYKNTKITLNEEIKKNELITKKLEISEIQLKKASQKNEQLQTENEELSKSVKDLTERSKDYDRVRYENRTLKNENAQAYKIIEDKDKLIAESDSKIRNIKTELEQTQGDLKTVKAEKKAEQARLKESCENRIKEISAQKDEAIRRLSTEFQGRINNINQSHIDEIDSLNKTFTEQINALHNKHEQSIIALKKENKQKVKALEKKHLELIEDFHLTRDELEYKLFELEKLAYLDNTYSIPNKNAFFECLNLVEKPACVIVVDICDGFRRSSYYNSKRSSRATRSVIQKVLKTNLKDAVFVTGYEQLTFIVPRAEKGTALLTISSIKRDLTSNSIDIVYTHQIIDNNRSFNEREAERDLSKRRNNLVGMVGI